MFFSGSAQVEKGFLCRALADIPLPVVLASLTRSLSNANIPPNTKEENTVSKIQLQYDSLAWDPSACALTETYKMEKRQNMFFFGNLNLDMFQIGSSAKYSRDEFVFQRCGFEAQDGGEWGGGGDARGRCVINHPYLHDLHQFHHFHQFNHFHDCHHRRKSMLVVTDSVTHHQSMLMVIYVVIENCPSHQGDCHQDCQENENYWALIDCRGGEAPSAVLSPPPFRFSTPSFLKSYSQYISGDCVIVFSAGKLWKCC